MEEKKIRRSENAFVKQIFDKDTGKSLVCHLHQEEEGEDRQTFSVGWWHTNTISYDFVMDEVVEALRREKKNALRIRDLLSSRVAAAEKAHRMEVLTERARKIFEKMSEIEAPDLQLYQKMERADITEAEYQEQHSIIINQLSEQDIEFSALMDQMDDLNKVFSKKNPWIKTYGTLEIPETLTKAQVRKWIDRVLVRDLTTVEITLPEEYAWWKAQLPSRWQEERR